MKPISAIILAAGFSRRFGNDPKLLAKLDGKTVLGHLLSAIAPLPFCEVKVVTNKQGDAISDLCRKHGVDWIVNPNAHLGMGASIAAGVSALKTDTDGVLIALGDMPFIRGETYRALFDAFAAAPEGSIVAPIFNDRRGHPVIFDQEFVAKLKSLNDDQGARAIIKANSDMLIRVSVDDPGVVQDIDTPRDLDRPRT